MSTPQRIPQYFYAGPDMVPAWEFMQKWVPGAWRAVGEEGSAFLNGWRHYLGGNGINSPALWRRNGDFVELAGGIDKAGGNFIAAENILQMPPELRIPTSTWVWNSSNEIQGAGNIGMGVFNYVVATGMLVFGAGHTPAGGAGNPVGFVNLTGFRFPLL